MKTSIASAKSMPDRNETFKKRLKLKKKPRDEHVLSDRNDAFKETHTKLHQGFEYQLSLLTKLEVNSTNWAMRVNDNDETLIFASPLDGNTADVNPSFDASFKRVAIWPT